MQGASAGRGRDSRLPVRLHLWEVATGKLAREITFGSEVAGIIATVFAPDGKSLACGVRDSEGETGVRLLETATGREVKKLPANGLSALLFLPDGKTLLGWSLPRRLVLLWDVGGKGQKSVELGGAVSFRSRVRPAVSADGKLLAFPKTANVIGVVDLATGKPSSAPAGHDLAVTALAFAADGKTLLTGGTGQDGRRWDVSSGRTAGVVPLSQAEVVVSAPDGKSLARLGSGELQVVDVAGTGRVRRQLPLENADGIAVAFSTDGKRLALLLPEDRRVKVFDAATLKELRTLTPSCVKTDDDESSPDAGPFFAPDGRLVAAPDPRPQIGGLGRRQRRPALGGTAVGDGEFPRRYIHRRRPDGRSRHGRLRAAAGADDRQGAAPPGEHTDRRQTARALWSLRIFRSRSADARLRPGWPHAGQRRQAGPGVALGRLRRR